MRECKGCAERRAKLKAYMQALIAKVNPKGPPTPQISARPIKPKKELPS